PVARLLEPRDRERLHPTREGDCVLHREAAVGIYREDEVGPGGGARGLDALRVGLRGEAAHLELAAGHAGLAVELHLAADVGQRLALAVVAADRDDGQAPARLTAE